MEVQIKDNKIYAPLKEKWLVTKPKGTTDAIKYYIQDNYASFEKEWLQNFKPVLDKLLDVFDFN